MTILFGCDQILGIYFTDESVKSLHRLSLLSDYLEFIYTDYYEFIYLINIFFTECQHVDRYLMFFFIFSLIDIFIICVVLASIRIFFGKGHFVSFQYEMKGVFLFLLP